MGHNKYRILLIHNQNRICNNVVEKQPVDVKMKEIEKEEVVNSDDDEEKGEVEVRKIKSYTDIMKMKVDKLMANPDKPVFIPERPTRRRSSIITSWAAALGPGPGNSISTDK